jgi:hypothetical protein
MAFRRESSGKFKEGGRQIKVVPLRALAGVPSYSGDPTPNLDAQVPRAPAVIRWTPAQVSVWITAQGFALYAPLFMEHEVDGASLLELDCHDLSRMGIGVVGHRHTLNRRIRTLAESP